MCGIFSYVGLASDVLLGGLDRLDYCGYDSAGMVVFDEGQLAIGRAVGRVIQLSNALSIQPLRGNNRQRSHSLGNPRTTGRAQLMRANTGNSISNRHPRQVFEPVMYEGADSSFQRISSDNDSTESR